MIKTILLALAITAAGAGQALATEKKLSLSAEEMLGMIDAINKLGPYQELDRNRNAVTVNMNFASATILTLAADRSRLVAAFQVVQEAAKSQHTGKADHDEKIDTDIMQAKNDVTLTTLDVKELRLDQNPGIPPRIISILDPILDGVTH